MEIQHVLKHFGTSQKEKSTADAFALVKIRSDFLKFKTCFTFCGGEVHILLCNQYLLFILISDIFSIYMIYI